MWKEVHLSNIYISVCKRYIFSRLAIKQIAQITVNFQCLVKMILRNLLVEVMSIEMEHGCLSWPIQVHRIINVQVCNICCLILNYFFNFLFYLVRCPTSYISTVHKTASLADEGNSAYYQSSGANHVADKVFSCILFSFFF